MSINKEKQIKEINLWAFAASVLPLTCLAVLFMLWYLEIHSWVDIAMVAVATGFFTLGAIWWWRTMHLLKMMVSKWHDTSVMVKPVLDEIQEIKKIFQEILFDREQDK